MKTNQLTIKATEGKIQITALRREKGFPKYPQAAVKVCVPLLLKNNQFSQVITPEKEFKIDPEKKKFNNFLVVKKVTRDFLAAAAAA